MTEEAHINETEAGLRPADDGWFILNLSQMSWSSSAGGGIWNACEAPGDRWPIGIGVHILHPGDAPGFYHAEGNQEGFLILSGECVAIVEGQERRMGPWDYLHCPPGTAHIVVGAGEGPCAVLMVGQRGGGVRYLPDDVAARHGKSVERESDSAREVYADRPPIVPSPSPWPLPGS